MLAYYLSVAAEDDRLAQELIEGLDPHFETAAAMFPGQEIDDETRQIGKVFNFSMIYGGGRPTIVRQLGVSWKEAGDLLGRFHRARPGVRTLNEIVIDVLQSRGYIKTIAGRRLHPQSEHKALNALLQGSAAELMKISLVKIHEALHVLTFDSHLVSSVHDEAQIDSVMAEVPELVRIVPELMKHEEVETVLPVEVGIEITTTNWANKESYHSG